MEGSPSLVRLLFYGLVAAAAVGLLEAAVTRGFRDHVGTVPAEVAMLGTALNVASVAAGAGVAMLCGEVLDGFWAWTVAGFAVAATYVLTESLEVLLAEGLQKLSGNPQAEDEEDS